jgi:hypothetical protein
LKISFRYDFISKYKIFDQNKKRFSMRFYAERLRIDDSHCNFKKFRNESFDFEPFINYQKRNKVYSAILYLCEKLA